MMLNLGVLFLVLGKLTYVSALCSGNNFKQHRNAILERENSFNGIIRS